MDIVFENNLTLKVDQMAIKMRTTLAPFHETIKVTLDFGKHTKQSKPKLLFVFV